MAAEIRDMKAPTHEVIDELITELGQHEDAVGYVIVAAVRLGMLAESDADRLSHKHGIVWRNWL